MRAGGLEWEGAEGHPCRPTLPPSVPTLPPSVPADPTASPFSFPPSREQCLQLRENHHCQLEIRVRLGSGVEARDGRLQRRMDTRRLTLLTEDPT